MARQTKPNQTPRRADLSHTTRQRLLDAAVDVFSDKGYRDARISDICRKAAANVAAVNYYFGSKEKLYTETWRHSFERATAAHPPDGGVGDDAPADQRLRAHIGAFLARGLSSDNAAFVIMHMELANPTGLLDEVRREMIAPLRQRARSIIAELLDASPDDLRVKLCEMSTMGQCIHLIIRRIHKFMPEPAGPDDIPVAELADHITRFSLAGIEAIRTTPEPDA